MNTTERTKQNNGVCWRSVGRWYPLLSTYLYNRSTNSSIEPNPVKSRDQSVSRNRTKDDRTESLPLLCEIIGVNLSEENCQDHCQYSDQVHLTPVLKQRKHMFSVIHRGKGRSNIIHSKCGIFISVHDYLFSYNTHIDTFPTQLFFQDYKSNSTETNQEIRHLMTSLCTHKWSVLVETKMTLNWLSSVNWQIIGEADW